MHENHYDFVATFVKKLRKLCTKDSSIAKRVEQLQESILCIVMLDLEPIREELLQHYSQRNGGRAPRDPVCMFRCFLLMFLLQFTSVNKWAQHFKTHLELVILSGFSEDDVPGVGTFYDFIDRLYDGHYQKRCQCHPKPSSRFKRSRGRFRRNLAGEKEKAKEATQLLLAEKSEKKVEHLVNDVLAHIEKSLPNDFLHIIEKLLWKVAVIPSANQGLLGELKKLHLIADGSALASGASRFGQALCDCHKTGEYKCDCDRTFSDPDAQWGWDNSIKKTIFGHRFHEINTCHEKVELPLHLMIQSANFADVVLGVEAFSRVQKLLNMYLPGASVDAGIFDAGYDVKSFYHLLTELGMKPLIPLNPRTKTPVDQNQRPIDENGVPLCPGGVPYRYRSVHYGKKALTYHCPAKYHGRSNGCHVWKVDLSRCPQGQLCQPDTKMGPVTYVYIGKNPRLNLPLPRDSEQFKQLYKKRTSSERIFSFLKEAGKLKYRPYRRQHYFLFAGLCRSIILHSKAWVNLHFGKKKAKDAFELFEQIEAWLNVQRK